MNRLALAFAACLAFTACALSSQTQIPAAQTFLLGGEQRTPIRVEGRNIGPVAVDLLVQKSAGGEPQWLRRVEPGALFSRSFAAGERVLVRNGSDQRMALVQFELNGDVSRLSMTYDKPQR